MRLRCFECGKPVSTELPDDTVFRAVASCPECLAKEGEQKTFSCPMCEIRKMCEAGLELLDILPEFNSSFYSDEVRELYNALDKAKSMFRDYCIEKEKK